MRANGVGEPAAVVSYWVSSDSAWAPLNCRKNGGARATGGLFIWAIPIAQAVSRSARLHLL
jgi:hypothetical protein